MSMNRTPGPWEADGIHYLRDFRICQNVMADDGFVAAVGADGPWHITANARLIAAAPDGLAFAKALDASWLETFQDGPDGDYGIVGIGDEHANLWRMCRAFIAKAEGRP